MGRLVFYRGKGLNLMAGRVAVLSHIQPVHLFCNVGKATFDRNIGQGGGAGSIHRRSFYKVYTYNYGCAS